MRLNKILSLVSVATLVFTFTAPASAQRGFGLGFSKIGKNTSIGIAVNTGGGFYHPIPFNPRPSGGFYPRPFPYPRPGGVIITDDCNCRWIPRTTRPSASRSGSLAAAASSRCGSSPSTRPCASRAAPRAASSSAPGTSGPSLRAPGTSRPGPLRSSSRATTPETPLIPRRLRAVRLSQAPALPCAGVSFWPVDSRKVMALSRWPDRATRKRARRSDDLRDFVWFLISGSPPWQVFEGPGPDSGHPCAQLCTAKRVEDAGREAGATGTQATGSKQSAVLDPGRPVPVAPGTCPALRTDGVKCRPGSRPGSPTRAQRGLGWGRYGTAVLRCRREGTSGRLKPAVREVGGS